MKRLLLFVSFASASAAFASTAPDAIAGKVYHETGGIGGLRNKWELSFSLGADGRYSFLKYAYGSTLALDGAISLLNPPNDGTYAYARTTDADATLTLLEPAGTLFSPIPGGGNATTLVFHLRFITGTTGLNEGGRGFALSDLDANQSAPAINVSLRGTVAVGRPLIAGFVIPGTGFDVKDQRDVLIRVSGPALAQFGVAGFWTDPDFQLYNVVGLNSVGAHFGDWSQRGTSTTGFGDSLPPATAALQKIFAAVGAFPLPANSKDAVGVIRLAPGAYTIVCAAPDGGPGGEALVEVYFVP